MGNRVDLDSLREGGTGSYSELEEQPSALPYKYECGTVNSVGISGLGAGLKFIFKEGLERIRAHEQYLIDRLIEGLSNMPGVIIYRAKDGFRQVPILSFNIEGYEPGEVGAILDQAFDIKVRTGLHCAPAAHKTLGTYPLGTVRLSPGYFNSVEEIDLTVQAVQKLARTELPKGFTESQESRKAIALVGRRKNTR